MKIASALPKDDRNGLTAIESELLTRCVCPGLRNDVKAAMQAKYERRTGVSTLPFATHEAG